jgi:hypothetical protein
MPLGGRLVLPDFVAPLNRRLIVRTSCPIMGSRPGIIEPYAAHVARPAGRRSLQWNDAGGGFTPKHSKSPTMR